MSLAIADEGPVRVLTMDDGKANVLSPTMLADLSDAVDAATAAPGIAALAITGREGMFSGGFDLAVMSSGDPTAIGAMVCAGGELVAQLYGLAKPVVAACTGHAIAAGALLLLGCDVRVGPDANVKIGLNEVANGMVLPHWAMTIATERLSRRHVQQAVVDARIYDGPGAADAGFLDETVDPSTVVAAAVEAAGRLAGLDPGAYGATVTEFRGTTLERMRSEIAADRARLP